MASSAVCGGGGGVEEPFYSGGSYGAAFKKSGIPVEKVVVYLSVWKDQLFLVDPFNRSEHFEKCRFHPVFGFNVKRLGSIDSGRNRVGSVRSPRR